MMRLLSLLLLLTLSSLVAAKPAKKLLLVGQGPDNHPRGTHEYLAGVKLLQKCLKDIPDLETTVVQADEPWRAGPDLLARTAGVVIFVSEGGRWLQQSEPRWQALQALTKRGGGVVVLHWGMGTREASNIEGCLKIFGGCHGGPQRKYKVLATTAEPLPHPSTTGISRFKVRDEFYYQLHLARQGLQPVLQVDVDGKQETVAWAWERPDGGRSFGFSGLHFHENWQLPEYQRLITQGTLWSLRLPVPKNGIQPPLRAADIVLPVTR